jgi:membrane protein YdbS with pleckstrin-like domain
MTRSARLLVFVLVATVLNVLATAIIFVALIGLYAVTLGRILPPEAVVWAVGIFFLLALIGTAFVYRRLVAFARTRYKLDELLGPERKPF